MRLFREALHDVSVRVSEETLLEVGRYFQAPTLKSRRRRQDTNDSRHGTTPGSRDAAIDCALFEISYVPLMDVVFGRRSVVEHARGNPSREEEHEWDGPPSYREETPTNRRLGWDDDQQEARPDKGLDERSDDDGHCYVSVDRIRAARVAVIEIPDSLGRSPLFLAAVAGRVSAAKTLIRHGAAYAVAVEGTGLTPYSVAPSLLMRRVLAAEARRSLYLAISDQPHGDCAGDEALVEDAGERTRPHGQGGEEGQPGQALNDAMKTEKSHRMEMWVSTLAEEELVAHAGQVRADQKTSLHLAAAAGLPAAIKDLLDRGIGRSKDERRRAPAGKGVSGACSPPPTWRTSLKFSDAARGESQRLTAPRSIASHNRSRDVANLAALTTDANGWSPLHACCAEASPQHYSCALALLSSQRDPNARTNTGKTPLHVAASAADSPEVRGGVSR